MFKNYQDVVTTREAQEMLRIGRRGVYALITAGKLDARKIGRKYRILKSSIIRYLQTND